MAGAQHPSVTGMNERTLGRIDLILFDADYRDANAAVEDSWRVAVMASDPRARAAHERARAAAVAAANDRRDPRAVRVLEEAAQERSPDEAARPGEEDRGASRRAHPGSVSATAARYVA